MSEIRATTISDQAGSGPVTLTGQSAAKAWSNLNGSTSTERKSFNISSYTDNANGNFDYNFSNAMADADYSVSTAYDMNNKTTAYNASLEIEALLSSDANLLAWYGSGGGSQDCDHMHANFHGDLA